LPGPSVLSLSQAATELSRRHGFPMTYREVSFLVRVMGLPTHKVPSNGNALGLGPEGFRKLDRFLGRERKVGA
jgi:hypothetical protein